MKTIRTIILFAVLTSLANAGGLDKVGGLMEKLETALNSISLVTITVAFLYVGYKIIFGGSSFRDMSAVIIGALVIAGAAELAKMLVG